MKKEIKNWEKTIYEWGKKFNLSWIEEKEIYDFIRQERAKDCQKFIDALIWCSGSEDFQIGGKARKGWEKICLPLIKR